MTVPVFVGRLVALLLMGTACAASTSIANPEVKIRVQDPKGSMISNAYVVMHHEWDQQGNESAEEHRQDELIRLRFDSKADFITTVKPGIYDVYASSPGFDPKCSKVRIAYGTDRALVFQLVENKWIYTPTVE